MDEKLTEIMKKIELKHKEVTQFVKKYQDRQMTDLVEYYKGAEWAFSWIKKEISEVKE